MAYGDFHIDYAVKASRTPIPGRKNNRSILPPHPPDGHPRRCQGRSHQTRLQCRRYALTGNVYCAVHNRRVKVFSVASKNIYALRASKKMKALMDEIASNPDERMELAGEIDATRAFAAEAIETCSAVIDKPNIGLESKVTAIKLAQEALNQVSVLVEKHAKICALTDGLLSPSQVDAVIKQVTEIVANNVNDEALKERILDQLADVIVPKRSSNIQVNIL